MIRAVALACLAAVTLACLGFAESLALVVGVAEYADPSIVDLEYAASDAREVALTLETSCGFERRNILILTDGEATRAGILAGLDWLAQRAGPSDAVFIYFAGHGTNTIDVDGDEADGDRVDEVFLPQDAVVINPATFLVDDELGARVGAISAGAVAMFFDACYSGGQSRWSGAQVPDIEARGSVARDILTAGLGGPARAVLAACQPRELAYENPTLRHGVFTHYLLQGLTSDGVDNGDDVLTVSEVADYVLRNVAAWSALHEEKQTPVLDMPPGTDIALVPELSASRHGGPQLVVYYPFDDDLEEKASSYATVNRGGEAVPGVIDGAARFDNAPGHTTYVRTPESYAPLEGPFAVSLWFRAERVPMQGFLFSTHARYNDYGPEYGVALNGDGSITFRTDEMRGQNRRQELSTTTYRWDDAAWHHLVVQRLPEGRKEVWIDGRLEASETYSIHNLQTGDQPLTIGGSAYASWSSSRSYVGLIDDFRIYSGALDPAEIGTLFAMGVPEEPMPPCAPAVDAAIRSELGLAADHVLTTHDARHVRALQIVSDHDLSVSGLEACVNLRALRVQGAGLRDLSFVRSLPALVELAVPGNRLAGLDALAGRVSLEILDLSRNEVSDLQALATLPYLAYVDLSWNRIGDLSPLANLTKMKELSLRGNAIADVSPLASMGQLRRLDVGQNKIRNVLPLVALSKLVSVALDGNGLSDISALAQMTGLEEINLSWNEISDISPLAGLEWLGDYTMDTLGPWHAATLELAGNLISDPSPLLGFAGLGRGDSVDLSWNPLGESSAETRDAALAELRARGVIVLTE